MEVRFKKSVNNGMVNLVLAFLDDFFKTMREDTDGPEINVEEFREFVQEWMDHNLEIMSQEEHEKDIKKG